MAYSASDRSMWNLIELFTNMDLAQLAVILDHELLPSLEVPPFDGKHSLGDASTSSCAHSFLGDSADDYC